MFPIGFLAEILFGFLIEMLGYGVARVTIPAITLGRVTIDPVSSSSERYNWLGARKDGERIVLGPTVAGVLGIIIAVLVIFALLLAILEPQ